MSELVHLQVRNPKDDETPIEAATQIFASLLPAYIPMWKQLWIKPKYFAFELYLYRQTIYFYVTVPQAIETFISSLITSSFPNSVISKTNDPLPHILSAPHIAVGEVVSSYFYLPTKTYQDFKDIDPMSSVLGFLSKRTPTERAVIQILVTPASFPWADRTVATSKQLIQDMTALKYTQNPQKLLMMKKSSFQGGKALIRLVAGTEHPPALPLLQQMAGTFGSFSLGEGSQYGFKRRIFFSGMLLNRIKNRSTYLFERRYQILNSQELATIWHPPGFLLGGIRNIAWGKTLSGEPPENLPVAKTATEEERKDANYFATAEFKNENQIFGIKTPDRRKHVYIVGKTGTGKSTLIANMAIDDIRKGRGVGIVDPHGDLSEIILDYIPNRRVNDVVYLEPFDTLRPFRLNVLENKNGQHKDLIASGIVSIFSKLYGDSWGPRLEYILRNVILSLLEIPGATLVDVLPLLADREFRQRNIPKIQDPVIRNFWLSEFEKMPDKLRAESISPIQNKVGQFVSSQMIRNIIGHAKSTVSLEEIMNEGKIVILNLSQGKLGEDNSALLGAMIITQIQLSAMNRAYLPEAERRDFFLYVDEFQNFATAAFVKILSEARKYRLSLTMANQYIEQLDETIQRAIFGNIGTLISFVVGARDAYLLSKEFGEIYSENDLVSLGKYETVLKLSIDGMMSMPFPARTLPLPNVRNENRDKIVRLSKEKFGRQLNAPAPQLKPPPPEPNPQVAIPKVTVMDAEVAQEPIVVSSPSMKVEMPAPPQQTQPIIHPPKPKPVIQPGAPGRQNFTPRPAQRPEQKMRPQRFSHKPPVHHPRHQPPHVVPPKPAAPPDSKPRLSLEDLYGSGE